MVGVSVTTGGAATVVVGLIVTAMGVGMGVGVVVVEVSWLDVVRMSHAAVAVKCVTSKGVAVVVVRQSSVMAVMS